MFRHKCLFNEVEEEASLKDNTARNGDLAIHKSFKATKQESLKFTSTICINTLYIVDCIMKRAQETSVQKAEKLEAFSLYREKGLSAVKSMFPKHVAFVLEHKDWKVRAVKDLLFPTKVTA